MLHLQFESALPEHPPEHAPPAEHSSESLLNLAHAQSPLPVRVLRMQRQLAAVHEARRTEFVSPGLMRKIGRTNFNSPTFKKLFTHSTWANYTGMAPEARWRRMLVGWRGSSILRAVLPRTIFVTAWSVLVVALGRRLPMSPIALQLQGTAIGLLLVFRNDAAYQRLAEGAPATHTPPQLAPSRSSAHGRGHRRSFAQRAR